MKSLVVLLVVSSAFVGVHSFFGRQLAVPTFESQLSTAWGSGTAQMKQLNDQMLARMELDGMGTFAVVQPVMKKISESISGLIREIMHDIVNQDGNTAGLMQTLRMDIARILGELNDAKATITQISGIKIRASIATAINDVFSKMITEVNTLRIIMNEFEAFLNSLDQGDPDVEPEADQIVNIATVIATVKHFRLLRLAFNSLANNLSLLIQVRNNAIDAQVQENATVFMSENFLNTSLPTDFNQTTSTALTALLGSSDTQMARINSSFDIITLSRSVYNNGDISNLTAYLGNLTNIINNCYKMRMPELTQELQEEVTYVLGRKGHKLALFLINMVQQLTDMASISPSTFADTCANRFIGQMQTTRASLMQLQFCIQPEKQLINGIFKRATDLLTSIMEYATIPQTQLAMCSFPSGACVKKYFANFPHYGGEMRSFIAKSIKGIAEEMELSMVRIDVCVRAVTDDIQEFAEAQRTEFNGCLVRG